VGELTNYTLCLRRLVPKLAQVVGLVHAYFHGDVAYISQDFGFMVGACRTEGLGLVRVYLHRRLAMDLRCPACQATVMPKSVRRASGAEIPEPLVSIGTDGLEWLNPFDQSKPLMTHKL
jgi:hypothetical protein